MVLRRRLPHERDVGLASLDGFHAIENRRIDADLAVIVAAAQDAIRRAVINGRDDGRLRLVPAAPDLRVVADVKRCREPEAMRFRPAEVPAIVEEHLGAAARELRLRRREIRHGDDAQGHTEVFLDAVGEKAQRPLERALLVDVGERPLARDDDDGDDGMEREVILFALRQVQAEPLPVIRVNLVERREEAWAVFHEAVGCRVELAQQRVISRAHGEIMRADVRVRRLQGELVAAPPAHREAREAHALRP